MCAAFLVFSKLSQEALSVSFAIGYVELSRMWREWMNSKVGEGLEVKVTPIEEAGAELWWQAKLRRHQRLVVSSSTAMMRLALSAGELQD
jgi:hypothetical protein